MKMKTKKIFKPLLKESMSQTKSHQKIKK